MVFSVTGQFQRARARFTQLYCYLFVISMAVWFNKDKKC